MLCVLCPSVYAWSELRILKPVQYLRSLLRLLQWKAGNMPCFEEKNCIHFRTTVTWRDICSKPDSIKLRKSVLYVYTVVKSGPIYLLNNVFLFIFWNIGPVACTACSRGCGLQVRSRENAVRTSFAHHTNRYSSALVCWGCLRVGWQLVVPTTCVCYIEVSQILRAG